MGWKDAPLVGAIPGNAIGAPSAAAPAWASAPVVSTEDIQSAGTGGPPGIMQRIKGALIAPVSERDPSFGDAVKNGILGIPGAIGQDFVEGAKQLKRDIAPQTPQERMDAAPMGGVPKPILDVAGMALSPITGALKSAVGRPVEQATGIRRGVTGEALSALVPISGEVNLARDAAKAEKLTAAIKPAAVDARAAGYVLPPKMISDKPGIVANTLAAWSGKVKTAQAASAKNQEVTNALAAKSLGLPDGAELTGSTFKDLRAEAGKAYSAIPQAVPQVAADDHYLETVSNLGGANSRAAKAFPNITKNQAVIDLADELKSVKTFPTDAGLEIVKELRSNATSNLKAFNDPSKGALGIAQRQAADAVDDLIERNVSATGDTGLVKAYKDARAKIAKSYDVEAATNPDTGNVNAHAIGKLAAKGRPLTDELATIAKIARAFPKAMQSADKFGEVEPLSVLDMAGAAATATHGNLGVAGAILGRPLVRKAILSAPAQDAMVSTGATSLPVNALRRAPAVNALQQLTYQAQ